MFNQSIPNLPLQWKAKGTPGPEALGEHLTSIRLTGLATPPCIGPFSKSHATRSPSSLHSL